MIAKLCYLQVCISQASHGHGCLCRNVQGLIPSRKGLSQAVIQVFASWHTSLVSHEGGVTLLSSSSSANCQLGIRHQNSKVIFHLESAERLASGHAYGGGKGCYLG